MEPSMAVRDRVGNVDVIASAAKQSTDERFGSPRRFAPRDDEEKVCSACLDTRGRVGKQGP